MQQERGSNTGGGDHHNIHQRLMSDQMKGKLQDHQKQQVGVPPPPPHQPPQKCPRCDSLNTKFCYYNNYSLSQPRYFCKTCRRYWTQGGTLRNVPVGGGCRKGKRSKKPSPSTPINSTSNTTSISTHDHHQNLMNISTTTNPSLTAAAASQNLSSSSPLMAASGASPLYYPNGGFLSSLAAFQAPFNQAMNIGDHFSSGSNLALLQGFSLPSITPHHRQQQVFNMGIGRDHDHPFGDGTIIHESNRPSSSTTSCHHHHHQEDWNQSFHSNNNGSNSIGTSFWSGSTSTSTAPITTTTTTTINSTPTGHHWSDLPGFGPLPTTASSSPSFL